MTEEDLTGVQLDEYQLETMLGEGGMARVYGGLDVYLKRRVAIKVISPTLRQDKDYLERFEREARAIASLEHPHIVRLYRYGEANGLLYMAMQFIEGSDLGSVLRSYRQDGEYLEYPEAARLIREIGAALDYVHAQSIIHRDVKSSNIMLDRTGQAYLADFGLALLTQVGTRGEIFGSPHYLAPEQAISSAKAVPQSDLYSLGVVAWEMFTGQLPFDAKDPLEIAMQHMSKEPPRPRDARPELPARLEAVLLKALAKKPAARYQSGADLAAAVDAALVTPITADTPEPPPAGKTIPERVALHLAGRPLPPIPAAVTPLPDAPAGAGEAGNFPIPARSAGSPPGARPDDLVVEEVALEDTPDHPAPAPPLPAASRSTRSPWIALPIAAFVGLCMLVICLTVFILGRAGWIGLPAAGPQATGAPPGDLLAGLRDPTRTRQPDRAPLTLSTPDETFPAATSASTALHLTAAPTALPSPLPPQATATMTPQATVTMTPQATATMTPQATATMTPAPVLLIITRCRDGHCLGIINQGQIDLPLAGLVLGGKGFTYTGPDWDLTHLSPGACLVLTGNANRWAPKESACQNAAATLVSKENFWKEKLNLTYAGVSFGNCPKDSNNCEFVIPVE